MAWPEHDAAYEFPALAQRDRWQGAVDAALAKRRLRFQARYGDEYDLVGSCPHCGHAMSQ